MQTKELSVYNCSGETRGMMKTKLAIATAIIGLLAAPMVPAQNWVEGMSFVALSGGEWQLYVVPKGARSPQRVPTRSEPRTPTFHAATGVVAFIAADGTLHEQRLDGTAERLLLKPDAKRAYTQPVYDAAGKRLYVVELKEGASVDTDIVMLDDTRGRHAPVVTQPLAQFDPFAPTERDIYYSNVICTLGCGKIIQEIWHLDVVTGVARQLTLVNDIARQPALDRSGQWLYFSSNRAGHYHIWRVNMATREYQPLTNGQVTDTNPNVDAAGNLYFIRHSRQGASLMRMAPGAQASPLELAGIQDFRDLAVGR